MQAGLQSDVESQFQACGPATANALEMADDDKYASIVCCSAFPDRNWILSNTLSLSKNQGLTGQSESTFTAYMTYSDESFIFKQQFSPEAAILLYVCRNFHGNEQTEYMPK